MEKGGEAKYGRASFCCLALLALRETTPLESGKDFSLPIRSFESLLCILLLALHSVVLFS